MENYFLDRKYSKFEKRELKMELIGNDDLLADNDFCKDLLELDDENFLENFEHLNIENIFFDGEELQVDLNLFIEVPDYLAEKPARPSNKFMPKK
jgi:hypothetical protein